MCVRGDGKKNLFCGQRCKQPSKIGSSPSSQRRVWRATPILTSHKDAMPPVPFFPPHHKLLNWLWFSQSHGWIRLNLAWLSACLTPRRHAGVIRVLRKLQPHLPSQVCCCDCEWGQKVFKVSQQRLQAADLTNKGRITCDTLSCDSCCRLQVLWVTAWVWKAELSWGVCTLTHCGPLWVDWFL